MPVLRININMKLLNNNCDVLKNTFARNKVNPPIKHGQTVFAFDESNQICYKDPLVKFWLISHHLVNINKEMIRKKTAPQKSPEDDLFGIKDKTETIDQMKNIIQEKDIKVKENKEVEKQVNLIN